MIAAKKVVSEEDYLRYELEHEGRHEFDDGEIVAMTGAEPTHTLIASNLEQLLRRALASRGCLVLGRDQRVRVERRYFYPDVVVACGKRHFADDKPASLLNPNVIIEVTSDTTGLRDWTKKRKRYQRIASLEQYVIVDCPEPSVAVWTRTADGRWSGPEETDDGEVEIAGVTLRLPDIYEGVAALAAELGHHWEE